MEETFNIKQGVGSVNIPASAISNQMQFMVGGKQMNVALNEISEPPVELNGTISTDIEIPANTLVRIRSTLDIASTGSLTS